MKHVGMQTEVEVGHEEAVALRMIDYIQSVIAAVAPATPQKEDIDDGDWNRLVDLVGSLFDKLNGEYQICSTLRRKLDGTDYDEEIEEFRFRAQIYWTNVRGQRHYAHQIVALRELLEGQDELVKSVLGISAKSFIDELEKIWQSLIFGVGEAFHELDSI